MAESNEIHDADRNDSALPVCCISGNRQLSLRSKGLPTNAAGFGLLAPLAFIAIQIIQTVLPIIPGGVSSAVGIIVFGPLEGFIYNYVGLLIGAYLAFRLVRRYGKQFILKVVEKKTYDKYIGWLEKGKKFDFFFALAIFLPGMPDDILCMICALTTMSTKRFMLINLLCKPFGLILYSFGMKEILLLLSSFF